MKLRRCLTAFVTVTAAAACAAPAASAKTKTVFAGGPPPKLSDAGNVKFDKDLDLNQFFGRKVTIHVGDKVRWVFSKRVVHTVTFLDHGQSRPNLEQLDSANPYAGFPPDHNGAAFWFNGQPSLLIPPDHAFAVGGTSLRSQSYHNSGLSAPAFKSYSLKFTKRGTFKYICLVHPGMSGSVKVVKKSAKVPSAAADRKARIAAYKKAVKQSKTLADFHPTGNNVVAGHDGGSVAWFRFFPSALTIAAGQAVHFTIDSTSEIHTMTFGPQPLPDFVMVQPQPMGPPRLQFSPYTFLPSDPPPAVPPYTGTNHGDGFFNTGIIDTNPASAPPPSVDVTFTTPGTYRYECTIHPGMQATITVT
jgi:plastocyanin